jgi:hypothetical protein
MLMQQLSTSRQEKWIETLEKMDMTHNSKIAWSLIKKLNGDQKERKQYCNVTADQVATQLLRNGKTKRNPKTKRNSKIPKIVRNLNKETNHLEIPFTIK